MNQVVTPAALGAAWPPGRLRGAGGGGLVTLSSGSHGRPAGKDQAPDDREVEQAEQRYDAKAE